MENGSPLPPCAILPRWTVDSAPEGYAEVEVGLGCSIGSIAVRLGVPAADVLVGVHAKVLAALTGDGDTRIGCVAGKSGTPRAFRVRVPDGSWVDLIRAAAARTPDTGPIETVLDLTGGLPDVLPDGVVLWLGVAPAEPRLRLRYRTDAVDASAAGRIAGYHRTALAALHADTEQSHIEQPHIEQPHTAQSLLSAEEIRFQREELAGPARELPDRRFHELFEERVRRHPHAVAAQQGDRCWTYAELNGRANRIGHLLLARGLGREDVVAVAMERNLDWLAAVLAIFKAGCAYLPVEPHFPADRIVAMLGRSGCRTVLTESASATNVARAVAAGLDATLVRIDAPDPPDVPGAADDHPAGNLGVRVDAGQLAYIFFTSGSTGEPKGAMCEHAGMLNHLLAKVEDLDLDAGDVVAQIAPQCFDISLWQLLAPLLVGGRTLLVAQDVVLDVGRFIGTLVDGGVTVAQVVPSYLEVVLSHLDRNPRGLGRLRCVSVTGEALKKELAVRWFARCPRIALMNAYGLTETSDDTNHEVMLAPPTADRIPLGRAVRNVSVAVVDESLRPVPLGAPGEIVFTGVCVGRGYINDPERTRLAFLPDPAEPGARLYRSGDYGRWLADGKLEFLGRRDAQVKIRGFRVEIGDIENHLLRVPGVREAAVIVVDGGLAGFYTGTPDAGTVGEFLSAALPEYMVPASLRLIDELPLTANGKTDTKTLAALAAGAAEADGAADPPRTAAERRLAAAWADVLGLSVDRIGRDHQFFERGGTSLSAVRLVLRLDHAVSLRDVNRNPVLSDLAALLDNPAADSGTQAVA